MSGKSIFHKIVTKEDDFTQLLCNILQRERRLLGKLLVLVDKQFSDQVQTADIRPQVRLHECGQADLLKRRQADLLIETDTPHNLCMLFEVKIARDRDLEESQRLNGMPESYQRWLEEKKCKGCHCWLVYLVPGSWEYRQKNEEAIRKYQKNGDRRAIEVRQIYWHHVLELMQKDELRAEGHYIQEIWQLLVERLGPINFSSKETERMFQSDFPMKELIKINAVIEGLRTVAKKEVRPVSDSSEFGFYLVNGEREMFVGLWKEFWERGHHYPISFGVSDDNDQVRDAFSLAFERGYGQKPISFTSEKWTMGWVPAEDFNSFETANSIDEIWHKLAPIWESVKEVGWPKP